MSWEKINGKVKILIVDDDPDTINFLKYNLSKEGFTIFTAQNGKSAIEVVEREIPHLVLLDIMMPELDGVETCHYIRSKASMNNILISFLTARGEVYSEIAGFEAGADDYIQKPIPPRLLITRVKALLRRHEELGRSQSKKIINIENLKIDKEKFEVYDKNLKIHLPKKEFEILLLLLTRPGRVFTRKEIFQKIWGSKILVGERTIDVHVSKLREKLNKKYIKTVKGIGYKFEI